MRRSQRHRIVLGGALVAVLAFAFAVFWAVRPTGLSPAERQLVGAWQHAHGPAAWVPGGVTKVWYFTDDRWCRIDALDTATGQLLDTMAGRWSAPDGRLVCDWEGSRVARAKRVLPAGWIGPFDTKLDVYLVESAGDDEVVLRPRGGPATYPLQRVAGD